MRRSGTKKNTFDVGGLKNAVSDASELLSLMQSIEQTVKRISALNLDSLTGSATQGLGNTTGFGQGTGLGTISAISSGTFNSNVAFSGQQQINPNSVISQIRSNGISHDGIPGLILASGSIEGFTSNLMRSSSLQTAILNRFQVTPAQMYGSFGLLAGAGSAITGVGQIAYQSFLGSRFGSGEGYNPLSQASTLGPEIGAGIGALLGSRLGGFGGLAGFVAGGVIGGIAGNITQGLYENKLNIGNAEAEARAGAGLSVAQADQYTYQLGNMSDPIRGPGTRFGYANAAKIWSQTSGLFQGGLNDGNIGKILSESERLNYGSLPGMETDIRNLSNVANNPLLSGAVSGAYKSQSALSQSDLVATYLYGGPSGAEGIINSLRGRGRDAFNSLNSFMTQNQYEQQGAQGGIASSAGGLSITQSSGALPTSSSISSATQEFVSALSVAAGILKREFNAIPAGNPINDAKRAQIQGEITSYNAQAAQAEMAWRTGRATYSFSDISTSAGVELGAAGREIFELGIGGVAPSLEGSAQDYRRLSSTATTQANNTSLDPFYRLQMKGAASQALTQIQAIRREQDRERIVIPLESSESEVGRFSQVKAFGESQGFSASDLDLSGQISRDRGLLGSESRGYDALLRTGRSTAEERIGRLNAINTAQLQLRSDQFLSTNLPLSQASQFAGYSANVAASQASYAAQLGIDPGATLAAGLRASGALSGQAQAFGAQANQFSANGQFMFAAESSAAAQTTALQASQMRLGAESSFTPSASSRTLVSKLGTAISLAQLDPMQGGMVPLGVRQSLLGALGGQLGQLDAQIAGIPSGPEHDSAEAALQNQRSNLLIQMQQQRNALMFGDVAHLINIGTSSPGGNGGLAVGAGTSLASFQSANPGGTRALGSSGTNVHPTGLQSAELQNIMSSISGGGRADPIIVGLLQQIVTALHQKSGLSPANPIPASAQKPHDLVRNNSNGLF